MKCWASKDVPIGRFDVRFFMSASILIGGRRLFVAVARFLENAEKLARV